MKIKIPFQFKIYFLIFILFAVFMHLTMLKINRIITDQILKDEQSEFLGHKVVFYNLLNSKIESLQNEALLLSDFQTIQYALSDEPYSQPYNQSIINQVEQHIPRIRRWPLMIITNDEHEFIDGRLITQIDEKIFTDKDPKTLENYLPSRSVLSDVMSGIQSTRFVQIKQNQYSTLLVLSTVPVYQLDDPSSIIGAVTLGFAIDATFAKEVRSGSHYQIAFLYDHTIEATTLDSARERDFRQFWDRTSEVQRRSFVDEPKMITFFGERYLINASSLPTTEGNQGYLLLLNSLEDTLSSIQSLRLTVYFFSLLVLFGVLIASYFVARRVTAPIRQLVDAVSRISEGDYSANPHVKTGDEFEMLGQEIFRMSDALRQREAEIQEYVKQIEGWNKELESKVTARTKDLEEKNIRLRLISEELGRAYGQIDDELKIVGELQKSLMPSTSFARDELSIESLYLPNGRAGGDYYDFISPKENILFFLIADVSGHGTPAAFIMGITRAILHLLINEDSSPSEVLYQLSQSINKTVRSGEFVTMFLGRVDLETLEVRYASAGHLPPMLYHHNSGELTELTVNQGLPLGIVELSDYEEVTLFIEPGDRLLMYTDGIIEAANDQRNFYGEDRLQTIFLNYPDRTLSDLLEIIMNDLVAFVQHPLEIDSLADDVTLVAIDFKMAAVASTLQSKS